MSSCDVWVSVCLSRSWIMSKRINISSKFFHHRVATPFLFFHTKQGGDIPTGTPLTGASNAGRVGKKRDSGRAAQRSTVSSTVRVANCEKQSRDRRRRASSTPRRPLSVVRTRRRRSVCDGLDVIRRRRRSTPPDITPFVITPFSRVYLLTLTRTTDPIRPTRRGPPTDLGTAANKGVMT